MELQGGEDDLESKFSKLLERRKNVENQRKLQKEMPCGNVLLNKYESVNLIALRKMKQTAERKNQDDLNLINNANIVDTNINIYDIANDKMILTINSPICGKIRAKSATSLKKRNASQKSLRKNVLSDDEDEYNDEFYDDNSEEAVQSGSHPPVAINRSKSAHTLQSKHDIPTPEAKLAGNYLDSNLWWDDDVLHRNTSKLFRTGSENNIKKSKSNKDLTTSAKLQDVKLKSHFTETERNAFFDKSSSGAKPKKAPVKYLQDRKRKEKIHKEELRTKITQEAYNMESSCYANVERANSYARQLGKNISFHVRFGKNNSNTDLALNEDDPCSRLHKMIIEVTTNESALSQPERQGNNYDTKRKAVISSEAPKFISIDQFYIEHDKLQTELRRNRCLIPSEERVGLDKMRKDKTANKLQTTVARMAFDKILHGTAPLAGPGNNTSPLSPDSSSKKIEHGFGKAVKFLLSQNSGIRETIKIIKAQPVATSPPKNVTTNNKSKTLGTPSMTAMSINQEQSKLSQADIKYQLNNIITKTAIAAKVLEDQLHDIRHRGWNEEMY